MPSNLHKYLNLKLKAQSTTRPPGIRLVGARIPPPHVSRLLPPTKSGNRSIFFTDNPAGFKGIIGQKGVTSGTVLLCRVSILRQKIIYA